MMNRFYSWPIRAHLTILIALLAIPSVSLIVYSGLAERREAVTGAKTECLKFVNDVAGQQQAIVAGAEQLVTALGLLPEIQSRNSKATNAFLSELVKKNPCYANLVIGDPSGFVWASAIPFEGKLSMADRKYFQDAIRTGLFSSGEYGVGKASKQPMLSFGYPVKNASNELIAVIGVALDLDYAQQMFEKLNLPPGSSFSLLDHQGVILIRNLNLPSSEKLIGRRDTREENFTKMTDPHEGTYEAMGNDGLYRLAAYKKIRLPQESEPYIYVRSSIPLASAVSKANAAMLRNLSAFVLLFLIGLLLAWFIGKHLIVRPAMVLKGAAEQLAAGADTVHVSSVVKSGELGEVARAFDGMAEALVQRGMALRESEQRWATTLASIGDAVIATDVAGRITYMNTVAEEMTGWTLEEATMKPVTEVFHIINEQTRGEVENPVTKVLREGMIVGLANHTILVRKNGTDLPIDDSGAPIKDKDGNTTGVVLVFRDITERKQAEERTEHLASYPQLNPSPIIEVDVSGQITFSNPSSQAILQNLGLDKRDLKALLPHDLDAILRDWDKNNESTFDREVFLAQRVFGETIQLVPQFHVARIYARDITERKRAEEAVQTTLQRFYTVLSSMYTGLLLVTDESRVEFANQAFCDYFDLNDSPAELVGLTSSDIFARIGKAYLYPDEEIARIKEIVDRGQPVKGEEVAMRSGRGLLRDFIPIHINGKSYGRLWYHTDITERKKAHNELEKRVEERTAELSQAYETLEAEMAERVKVEEHLRQAQKMEAVGTLAGGIAHDFNNMLAAIIGNAELAMDDVPQEMTARLNLDQIFKAGMRARGLVRQILTFSRKTEHERKPISLTPLVKETFKLLRASLPTTIEMRLNVETSSDVVLADPVQIQQVLMNLCTNAADAMRDTGGRLEINLADTVFTEAGPLPEAGMQPGTYVTFTVSDTGPGMDEEVKTRIFEPFFTTKERGQGTGMGLAVVYGIVKSHQGVISVLSRPGQGATFTVYLPRYISGEKTDEPLSRPIPKGKERILFVDDEELLVEMAEGMLGRLGYSVLGKTDSVDALRIFAEDPDAFDLVITDQTMPEMTGAALAQKLKEIRSDIPLILCTGYSETISQEKAESMGIHGFVMKPLSRNELGETVRRVLDKKTGA
ncbi:MAG TPA: PAS domain S-box protein [Syntrophorhabdales bacterium]|nr:PAS domain S-box protein [Syntrophorhabdales bacterium]